MGIVEETYAKMREIVDSYEALSLGYWAMRDGSLGKIRAKWVPKAGHNNHQEFYIQALPKITAAEERALVRRMREGDGEAQEALVKHLIPAVKHLANRQVCRLGFDDKFQAGTVALMGCLERFDPSRGVRVLSYSWRRISGAIKEACYKETRWGTGITREHLLLLRRLRYAGIHSEELEQECIEHTSLDADLPNADVRYEGIEGISVDSEEWIMREEDGVEMLQWLGGLLTEKQVHLVSLYCGFDAPPLNGAEIARKLGTNKSVVNRSLRKSESVISDALNR